MDGFTLDQAAEILIYPLFSDEGGSDSERIYVKQIVQKYLATDIDKKLHYQNIYSENLQNAIKNIGG
jgi:hypothetical protein